MTANIQEHWHQLSPTSQAAITPLLSRWDHFANQLRQRASEVHDQARAGIAEILAIDVLNTGAISAAFSVIESRIRSLIDKISDGEEKLSAAWDEATDSLDAHGPELVALGRIEAGLVEQSRELQRELETNSELLVIKEQATWARHLYDLAQLELAQARECAGCGAPLRVDTYWQASNVTCSHCGAVGLITPGPATGLYFQGAGIHHLAAEAAIDAWLNEQQAERWYKNLRMPTEEDLQQYLGAVQLRWDTYHNAFQHYHPNWEQTIEAATAAKLAHYTAYDQAGEQTERVRNGHIAAMVSARDVNGIGQLLASGDMDPEEAARIPYERGDYEGAAMVLTVGHRIEGAGEPLSVYVTEHMSDLAS